MRQAVNGWLLVSAILVVLGIGAVISTRVIPGTTIPEGMMADWRRYATEVEKQKRTPSPITTRMLTETGIAQYESARGRAGSAPHRRHRGHPGGPVSGRGPGPLSRPARSNAATGAMTWAEARDPRRRG